MCEKLPKIRKKGEYHTMIILCQWTCIPYAGCKTFENAKYSAVIYANTF